MAASGEKYFASRPPDGKPYISHGLPFEKACAHHTQNTFGADRVYVVVSKSISQTDNFVRLQSALGSRIAAVHYGIRPHSPWEDVLAVAQEIKTHGPDLIVTLGAGSITDGVKVAALAAANDALDVPALERLLEKCKEVNSADNSHYATINPCFAPVINIPTTLSGAEFTHVGGATHPRTKHKTLFAHGSLRASLVVLDPALSLSTPRQVWLASGMRGVDHCVEGMCGTAPGGTRRPEEVRKELEVSLRALLSNLLITAKRDWDDADARLQEMLAIIPLPGAVDLGVGASHGIGHQLGPLGVGHGETSCVMLPHVLKYNWAHGDQQVRELQQRVREVFWSEETVVEVLKAKGLDKDRADTGDLVDAFVRELGMPRSLAEVGVGREHFDKLADSALQDWCTKRNPVKLDKKGVLEILEMAAGG